MAKTRIVLAKADIVKLFDNLNQNVFALSELQNIFYNNHSFWRLATNMSCNSFIEYLIKNSKLKKETFGFSYRAITRYTWGKVPSNELLLALKPKSYFSHYTALYFHELTEQVPKIIYINHEQDAKPRPKGQLEQEKIDLAFKCTTKISNNIAKHGDYVIRLLNGMQTGNAGVIESIGHEGEKIKLTDVERTLIDITVRPEYSGGPYEIIKAYKLAKDKVSVNRLTALLKKINYVYPYHQVVGFYLENAGVYKESQIDIIRKYENKYDFYLMHKMEEMDYSEKWRLYFPKGLI